MNTVLVKFKALTRRFAILGRLAFLVDDMGDTVDIVIKCTRSDRTCVHCWRHTTNTKSASLLL